MVEETRREEREGDGAELDDRVAGLAEAVLRRREDLGLRQAEVADLAGCSQRFLHTLEHGKTTLRLDKVLDVLAVLGLDLSLVPGSGRITGAAAGASGAEVGR